MIELRSLTLPDGFLREEVREGYTVSAKMKEVMAVQLDLLRCFINVCEKHNLRYFMICGTLLGAARHRGYIPWDDDIDMAMPLEDYVRLREIAGSELKEPYLLQSEHDFARGGKMVLISRLRNTETTGIFRQDFNMRFHFNQGIYIDIFPLIGMPPAAEREQYTREMLGCEKQMEIITRKHSDDPSVNIGDELLAQLARWEELRARYPISPATKKTVLLYSGSIGNDTLVYDYWDFRDAIPLPFEMLTPAAPCGYKNILRTEYGVWKKPVQQYTHGDVFYDTERPSEYWLSQPSLPEN